MTSSPLPRATSQSRSPSRLLWRLYYADSTWDGDWASAPARGVQALVTPDPDAGRVVMTNDFYLWWPGQEYPWSADAWGLMDYLLEIGALLPSERLSDVPYSVLRGCGVKLGRSLPRPEYQAVFSRAANDPDFPRKSARVKGERL